MTMDLWYDLAVKGEPDLDADVLDRLCDADAADQAPEVEPEAVANVDFF